MKKHVVVVLFLVVLAGAAVAGERTSVAAGDELPGVATAEPQFPDVAADQTRPSRIGTQDVQDPTYYDPEMSGGGTVDLCVNGTSNPDKRCIKDGDLYVCIDGIGRNCRGYTYPNNKFVCKTCFG